MIGARRLLLVGLLALALVVAAVSGVAYVAHHLWMGAIAVGLLALIAIFGSLSLWNERRRLAALEADLAAATPCSTLWRDRQARLQQLAKAGVRPDLEQLAQAVRAAEAGRAFLGKYFVAVTVLVGLVGTFAGLMEMLRGVQPLLAATEAPGLDVLLRPLIGLDVTFGASVVGILVTLALTLLAGDLTLAEEAMLARLEERTAHELVPALWPPMASAEQQILGLLTAWQATQEQTAHRLSAQLAGTIGQTFSHHTAQLVETIEAQVGGAHARTLQRLDETLDKAVHATLLRLDTTVARTLGELGAHLTAVIKGLDQSTREMVKSLDQTTKGVVTSLDHSTRDVVTSLDQTTRDVVTSLDQTTKGVVASLDASTRNVVTSLDTSTREVVASLDEAAQGVVKTLDQSSQAVARSLDQSAGKTMAALQTASESQLRALGQSIATLLGELGTQVAALTTTHRTVVDAEEQRRDAAQHAAQETFLAAATALQPLLVAFGDAARALSTETQQLTPALAGLSQEIALLAARSETTATPLVLDELARLAGTIAELQGERGGDPA